MVTASGFLNETRRERQKLTQKNDFRFSVPLYTVGEAARIVDVPSSTLASWARGYVRHYPDRPDVIGRPVITCFPQRTRQEPLTPVRRLGRGTGAGRSPQKRGADAASQAGA